MSDDRNLPHDWHEELGVQEPDWWTTQETLKLAGELWKKAEEKLSPKEIVKDRAKMTAASLGARVAVARIAASVEKQLVTRLLLQRGMTRQAAQKIAKRFASRMARQYMGSISEKFLSRAWFKAAGKRYALSKIPLRGKYRQLKALTGKAPTRNALLRRVGGKVIARGALKAIPVVGAIADVYTIGEAAYRGYQAHQAWEGAKEMYLESKRREQDLKEFRENMSQTQRDRVADLKRREAEFFKKNPHLGRAR